MSDDANQLRERLKRHAIDAPHRIAVREIASGRSITYSALQQQAAAFSGQLERGTTVMLRCANTLTFHIAFLGALFARLRVFPVAADTADREFQIAAAKSAAGAVIDSDMTIRSLGGDAQGAAALLLQSSGTTGLPKIVCRELPAIDAVAAQMVEAIGLTENDKVLACVPLCHSYGLEHGLLAPIFAGATVHLAGGFDLAAVRREFAASNISVFPAVPSIFEMLANLPEAGESFPSLRLPYSAGGPLPPAIAQKFHTRIGQLYGATEIGSVTFSHPRSPDFDPASVGKPMRGVELRLDPDGQLLVRAASMMSSYVGDESVLTPDGFFPTGDLAHIDQRGNLHITGRLKLLIDVGGLKVNPLEVELAISEHPAVGACVVVPMRLSETVSRLRAIVTPADPHHPPTQDQLRQFARSRLTSHKIPRIFELRASLPRSATGKVLRHLLVEST